MEAVAFGALRQPKSYPAWYLGPASAGEHRGPQHGSELPTSGNRSIGVLWQPTGGGAARGSGAVGEVEGLATSVAAPSLSRAASRQQVSKIERVTLLEQEVPMGNTKIPKVHGAEVLKFHLKYRGFKGS